jgi:hypothetical protein
MCDGIDSWVYWGGEMYEKFWLGKANSRKFWRLNNLEKNKMSIKEDNFKIQNACKELFSIQWEAECENSYLSWVRGKNLLCSWTTTDKVKGGG